jgi:hypothetical protein
VPVPIRFVGTFVEPGGGTIAGMGIGGALGLVASPVVATGAEMADVEWGLKYQGKWRICCRCHNEGDDKEWRPEVTKIKSGLEEEFENNDDELYYELP